jgi:hypothetical protein
MGVVVADLSHDRIRDHVGSRKVCVGECILVHMRVLCCVGLCGYTLLYAQGVVSPRPIRWSFYMSCNVVFVYHGTHTSRYSLTSSLSLPYLSRVCLPPIVMLIIGDTRLPKELVLKDIIDEASMKIAVDDFIKSDVHIVKSADKSICVLQSESVSVPYTAGICVGSDHATTCVMVIVKNGIACNVLHFDEDTAENEEYYGRSLKSMTRRNKDTKVETGGVRELFIIGGYDDHGTSEDIVNKILSWFHQNEKEFTLKLICTLGHNTNTEEINGTSVKTPKITCVCVTPEDRVVHRAIFQDHGPMYVERSCRVITRGLPGNLFDAKNGQFLVEPWKFVLEEPTLKGYKYLLTLDDTDLLDSISTSPDAEGPSFVEQARLSLSYLCTHPDTDSMFGEHADPITFSWNQDGGWK